MRFLRSRLFLLAGALLLTTLAGAAAKIPRKLLDITIDGTSGARYRPAAAKGKIRVIGLYSTECEPCRKSIAAMSRVSRQYSADKVQFFGAVVNIYATRDLAAFVAREKPAFPLGMLTRENTMRLADFTTDDRPYVPIMMFVDAKDQVAFQFYGDDADVATNDVTIKGVIDRMLKGN